MNFLTLFSHLDYFVFTLILLVTFISIYIGHKKAPKDDSSLMDHLLMGRQLTLPLFIATLVSTWYGGIFGVAQIAYESGLYNLITQGFFWYATYIVFALFILKKIKKTNATTLAGLCGDMFGKKSQKLSAIFNILNLVPVVYTISLGLMIQMFFHTSFTTSCIIGVVVVLGYSLFGGFRAIVYSDLIQFFVMIISVYFVLAFSFGTYGLSPLLNLPDKYFSITGGHSILETLSWGLIAISTLVDPNFYQRAFAAKNFKVAKKGILISTVIWFSFDCALTFGAMYAKAVMPEAGSEYGYFTYALSLLPNGLRGLFLAGILATVLSTLDSYLFLSGSTFLTDLAPKRLHNSKALLYFGIMFTGFVSIILASAFDGQIKAVWKALGSISACGLLIPILHGQFFKNKLSDIQFVITASTSAMCVIFWRLSGLKYTFGIDELYPGMAVSVFLIAIFCLFTKKTQCT